jgi:hypothetical protein
LFAGGERSDKEKKEKQEDRRGGRRLRHRAISLL